MLFLRRPTKLAAATDPAPTTRRDRWRIPLTLSGGGLRVRGHVHAADFDHLERVSDARDALGLIELAVGAYMPACPHAQVPWYSCIRLSEVPGEVPAGRERRVLWWQ